MAYTITGRIKFIGAVKTIQTRPANTVFKREVVITTFRFDPNDGHLTETGNTPKIEFSGESVCRNLNNFAVGQSVLIQFDLNGCEYIDQTTGKPAYFTSVRGFRIELYGNTTIATPSPTPAPKPRPNTGAEGASYPPVPANPYAGAPQPAQQGQYGNSQTNYEAPPF